MQQTQTYRERSRGLLSKAFAELRDEDLLQASEKGWGATAQIIKAVADNRGLNHAHHRLIIRLTHDLAQETGDRELRTLFGSANTLHSNFYEDILNHEKVEEYLQDVAPFIDRVERLLPN